MSIKHNQSGIALIFEVIAVAVVIAVTTFVIIKVRQHPSSHGPQSTSISYVSDTGIRSDTCAKTTNAMFTHDFSEPSKLKLIQPPVIDGDNVRDRAWPAINTDKYDKVAIYAPADVQLTSGVYKIAHEGAHTYDYDLWFQLSCDRWFFINHITDPVDKVRKLFPDKPNVPTSGSATADHTNVNPPVSFSSGELLGYTSGTEGAHNYDLGVFDLKHTNKLPASYGTQDRREVHALCSFDLFPDTIKAQYYAILKASPKEAGSLCPQ